MFKFLKKIFKEKEEKQEIKLDEIEPWFNERVKPLIDEITSLNKYNLNKFSSDIAQLKEQTNALENAELKETHETVDPKIKNIVLGHKSNYVRLLKHFLGQIRIPEPDYKKALQFCASVENELNEFGTKSVKSYYAVQHLFHNEVETIAETLKSINAKLNDMKKEMDDKNILVIENAKKKINEMKTSIKEKEETKQLIEEEKENLNNTIEQITNAERKKAELEQGEKYSELLREKENLDHVNRDINRINNNIAELFLPLDSVLRKFQRISLEDDKLVADYIKDSMYALLKDTNFKIVSLIPNIKRNIETNAIDLNDKKKEKAIEHLDTLTKETLQKLANEHNELYLLRGDIERKISLNNSMSMIKEAEYKIEHYKNRKEFFEREINSLNSKMESIDLEKIKNELIELIKKATNTELIISFSS
jgi:uncharacterized protein YukE